MEVVAEGVPDEEGVLEEKGREVPGQDPENRLLFRSSPPPLVRSDQHQTTQGWGTPPWGGQKKVRDQIGPQFSRRNKAPIASA